MRAHENEHALWFYANSGWDQILNANNYPSELRQFLQDEQKAIYKNYSRKKQI